MNTLQQFEQEQVQKLSAQNAVPEFAPGDTLRVQVKVIEGERERMQAYEGVCIAISGGGINTTFTVRKISYGEGVERSFPLYSPNIRVELIRRGQVRRAKLYYLRDRRGKSARIAEKTEYNNNKAPANAREAAAAEAKAESAAPKATKKAAEKSEE